MARTNNKGVANEIIIASLLQAGTIKEAARTAGVSTRTVYDRMNDKEFRAEYMAAKNDIMRKAVFNLNSKLAAAVDAVADIMTDKNNNAAVRLQAAQTILNNAGKYADILSKAEQAARDENKSVFDIIDNF